MTEQALQEPQVVAARHLSQAHVSNPVYGADLRTGRGGSSDRRSFSGAMRKVRWQRLRIRVGLGSHDCHAGRQIVGETVPGLGVERGSALDCVLDDPAALLLTVIFRLQHGATDVLPRVDVLA